MEETIMQNKEYTIENQTVINLTDEDGLLDFTASLFWRANIRVIPPDGSAAEKVPLTDDTLLSRTINTVNIAYIREYESGMPLPEFQAGKPKASLIAAIKDQLEESLSAHYGAAVASFDIEKHWISETDQQLLNQFLRMKQLRDPKNAAEALIQAMNAKLEQEDTVICPGCGSRVSRTKFCPECGRSFKNWRCSCGRVNETPFCPDCGSPAKDGTLI